MAEKTFHGVPRSKIPWHPTIDYEKCASCGKCLEYCKHDVYQFCKNEGKEAPVVEKPDNCIVYCNGCDAICPSGAISHPSKKETGKIIAKLRKSSIALGSDQHT